ncbi:hypothetical protein [Neobacillus sp. Marseille-QA0830]
MCKRPSGAFSERTVVNKSLLTTVLVTFLSERSLIKAINDRTGKFSKRSVVYPIISSQQSINVEKATLL